ncbi:unnamed protein product [Pieris macdunnoughi]|uniref:Uncharacterized protein n=1 Tax=Pieris macdunnoughi TaxID=345717 RepID=A0A821R8J0_9NEOP|nr:unnamed protein product [Pieris macdunnoughi]
MDLHLHLTVASRVLDRKWGTPIDLDTYTDFRTCLPAEIDMPTTTFSSEEYLRSVRRKYKPKRRESFGDISISRMRSTSDLGSSDSDISILSEHYFQYETSHKGQEICNEKMAEKKYIHYRRLKNVIKRLKTKLLNLKTHN